MPVLVGAEDKIQAAATAAGVYLWKVLKSSTSYIRRIKQNGRYICRIAREKGMTPEKAHATMTGDALFFGAMLVRLGLADGMCTWSSASPTANVLRAAIRSSRYTSWLENCIQALCL